MLDDIDRMILDLLQEDCRLPYAALAERVGLSPSTLHDRVQRLQARGVLVRCAGLVDPRRAGLDVCAFVQVVLDRPEHEAAFVAAVRALAAVQEAHHVTGPTSYLLKVRVRDTAALERLLGRIKGLPGVTRTESQIALSSPKETPALDLGPRPDPADDPRGRP